MSQDFSGEAGLFKNFNVNLQMLVTNYIKKLNRNKTHLWAVSNLWARGFLDS